MNTISTRKKKQQLSARHAPRLLLAIFGLGLAAGACTQPAARVAPAQVDPPAAQNRQIGHFTATFDHATRSMAIAQAATAASPGSKLEPMSLDPILAYPDGGGLISSATGSPLDGTIVIALNSTNCVDGYPASPTLQCDVELYSFFPRSLTNVYAEIDSVTLNGAPVSGYDALNSDPDFSTSAGELDNTHGLWAYNNPAEGPDAIYPVITSQAAGYNSGTRTWVFANPADEPVSYDIAIFATESYSSYTMTFGDEGYTDACAGGTSVNETVNTVTLPFDFTFYRTNTGLNYQSNRMLLCSSGELAFRGCSGLATFGTKAAAIALPSKNVLGPAFFPFWEHLKFGAATNDQAAGQICYQTLGSAPNRKFLVEWRNMDFGNEPDEGSSLDFEVYLSEGTGEIDTVYNTMVPAPGDGSGRESGSLAWVGMQNETATTATGEFQAADYGSGTAYTYIPNP